MEWQTFVWGRLADAAAGGLIVLAVGGLAARLCRQPVRRARLVVLTLLGGVIVPGLGALPVVPRWSIGLLPATAPVLPARRIEPEPSLYGPALPTLAPGTARFPDLVRPSPGTSTGTVSTAPTKPAPVRRWTVPAARTFVLGLYAAATAGLAAWWLLGQVVLWRVTRAARPVPGAVRELFLGLTGPEGGGPCSWRVTGSRCRTPTPGPGR